MHLSRPISTKTVQNFLFRMAFVPPSSVKTSFSTLYHFRRPLLTSLNTRFSPYRIQFHPPPPPSSSSSSSRAQVRMMTTETNTNSSFAEEGAKAPSKPVDLSAPTIFDKILAKEIPADVLYEDEEALAFRDINPQAPTHFLVIPKRRIPMIEMAEETDKNLLGHLMHTAAKVAKLEGLDNGYRILINNGPEGLQSVYHLHLHVIGGRKLKWGPF